MLENSTHAKGKNIFQVYQEKQIDPGKTYKGLLFDQNCYILTTAINNSSVSFSTTSLHKSSIKERV